MRICDACHRECRVDDMARCRHCQRVICPYCEEESPRPCCGAVDAHIIDGMSREQYLDYRDWRRRQHPYVYYQGGELEGMASAHIYGDHL